MKEMKIYNNYHKHDHVSNIFTSDTPFTCEDYLKRIKELGHDSYFTTNHGSGGDIFEARDLCDKYGIKCYFGVEGYIVPNPNEKDNRNYHIVIIPKTNEARKDINEITSNANEFGFYYKPRIFIEDLLRLDADSVYITTACVAGLLRDDDSIDKIFKPLVVHFGKNVMLEVQNHDEATQKEINRKAVQYAKEYGLELIAANDSHYIYPNQNKDRLEFLKGKGINYGDEDTYVLDFPDYDTMFNRFKKQGVLSDKQIERAIDNTLILNQCEEVYLDKEIKMPTAYMSLTTDEKVAELKRHSAVKFNQIRAEENIVGDKLKRYIDGIKYEMQIIEDTKEINTADYFLLNEKIVDLAVNKYGGILTRTGRGSCGAFYLNRILGMTQIDRFTSPIKLYPERFISTARLLENHSMPDIDYNVASQEPFVKAAREVLGEHMVYPMVAYGTMQVGEAFRNVCRSHNISFDEFNEVAKSIELYENDSKWKPYIDEAKKYVNVIVSASVHPCAHAMDNKDLRREYGIVKIGKALCVMITSSEADYWKVLKDDFLIVSVWGIISDTFKLIGKPIMTVNQLLNDLDDRIWKIYADGITCTLNQVDSDYATNLMKKYKVHSVGDMAMFTAAVRPSFDSWREDFLDRKPFTTGSKELDEVLAETEGRIIFQETLMTYFQWLGVTPAESIGLIKKISKKKIKQDDFNKLEERLKEQWIKNTGSITNFAETWQMVQSCMGYGFAAPHALATAIDSLYGAWLKVHYPLEYYTTALGYYEGDEDRTTKLTKELDYFGIKIESVKFGKARASYSCDKETNTIYKSVSSIKYLNKDVADELYALKDKQYKNFVELLYDIKSTSLNSRQLDILIKIGFFAEFGHVNALLFAVDVFNKFYKCKTIKIDKLSEMGYDVQLIMPYCGKVTDKTLSQIDNYAVIMNILRNSHIPKTTIVDCIKYQLTHLGYTTLSDPNQDVNKWFVVHVDVSNYGTVKATLYSLAYGVARTYKMDKKYWAKNKISDGDVILAVLSERNKWQKNDNGEFVKSMETELVVKCWRKED